MILRDPANTLVIIIYTLLVTMAGQTSNEVRDTHMSVGSAGKSPCDVRCPLEERNENCQVKAEKILITILDLCRVYIHSIYKVLKSLLVLYMSIPIPQIVFMFSGIFSSSISLCLTSYW